MDIIRDAKTTNWESDCQLATEIAEKLMAADAAHDPSLFAAIMEFYTAENVTILDYPPARLRDGYGSKRPWLDSEYASNLASKAKYQKGDGKRIRKRNIYAIGNGIIFDEYRVYPLNNGKLYEQKCLVVEVVYNGKIIGYYGWCDPLTEDYINSEFSKKETYMKAMEKMELLDVSGIPYFEE